MTHLQAERETVERLRRQLAERDFAATLQELSSNSAAENSGPGAAYLSDDTISVDWTSLGHHDWTG